MTPLSVGAGPWASQRSDWTGACVTGLNPPQRQRAPCQRCGPQGSGAEILTLAGPRAAAVTGASHIGGLLLTFYPTTANFIVFIDGLSLYCTFTFTYFYFYKIKQIHFITIKCE